MQVHTLEDERSEAMAAARGGMEPPYDGVSELWWEDLETLEESLTTADGRHASATLLEDERQFVDLPASPLWLSHEYPQVNPTPENIVARERSSIVKTHYPLRPREGLSEAEAQHY